VAESNVSGGLYGPSLQSSGQHPEIWKNESADRVAIDCIEAMMIGDEKTDDLSRLIWRDHYLCIANEASSNIPTHILQKVFHNLNISDDQALETGMRLYRFGGDKRSPVLVLAPQKPSTEQQAGSATCSPGAHIPYSKKGLVESVLRCVSHILKTDPRYPAPSQSVSPSLWHKLLSSIDSETGDIRFEDIPKLEDLLPPNLKSEILHPVNSGGMPDSMPPVIHLFQHVVSCLGISYLVNSESKSSSQEIVITLEAPALKHPEFVKAIAEHVQLGQNKIATPRVLAVSAQCPRLKVSELELDIGGSKRILYHLDAFIACPENVYSSYVRESSFYKVDTQRKRRQWKTIQTILSENHAFLLFVQDSARSPSEVEVQVGNQDARSSTTKPQKSSAQPGSTTQGQQKLLQQESRRTPSEVEVQVGNQDARSSTTKPQKSSAQPGSTTQGHQKSRQQESRRTPSEVEVQVGNQDASLSIAKLPKSSAPPGSNPQAQQKLQATAAPEPAEDVTLKFKQTAEIEKRIQVSSENPEGKIAQCASFNLSYQGACITALQDLRLTQLEAYELSGGKPACHQARPVLSDNAIESSLAVCTRPGHRIYGQSAGWIFIDQLCKKLRKSTGFTHSLQSLDLKVDEIQREFKAGSRPIYETAIFQYMADRGLALMQAVKYHNDFYNQKVDCQIHALQVSVITDPETSYAKYVGSYSRSLQEEQSVIFWQKMYAYLLHGMIAGMKTMPKLVIYLPVLENERQGIFVIMRGIQPKYDSQPKLKFYLVLKLT